MKIRIITLLTIISALLIGSCNLDENDGPANLEITFNHRVGNMDLKFDTIKYTNAYGNDYSVTTLKYFVSEIILTMTDGTNAILNNVFYVDAQDNNTGKIYINDMPVGDYESISFVFGLTEQFNISNLYPNPPASNMEWPQPLGGGYHYMKLEGKFDSANIVKNYQAHTGRLMQTPHFIEVNLNFDTPMVLSYDGEYNLDIYMDINNWWVNPNTLDLNNISGIMGNEEIQTELMENGSNVFNLGNLD